MISLNRKSHTGINIAVISDILQHNEICIIHEISQTLVQCPDVKVIIIGNTSDLYENITICRRHKTDTLQKIIKKHQIDLVFIPSVCPAVFLNAASGLISTNIPIACYNANPYTKCVLKYPYLLVLKAISPSENLVQMVKFILQFKRNKIA